MEEVEILRVKSDTYKEKMKMIEKEIDNMIIVKYESILSRKNVSESNGRKTVERRKSNHAKFIKTRKQT